MTVTVERETADESGPCATAIRHTEPESYCGGQAADGDPSAFRQRIWPTTALAEP